ncbi:hypothetical protein EQO05_14685 [Methanosarcina sp. MSH10X1]|uniref:hypothetical protein n=1 Tax=Methanosarcina sp. MSH10X1 TaxID=2507075 RepID=UPI000FFB9C43|nr:hypothetical protein [Methanosarcina sp. MSH10X1]RXA15655.1 hypothetical protein EQO05_14685 [Methanosarcina sp. MSH10X1]
MENEVTFQEKEIEKKERLAQTYILIFGLLLASNQNQDSQQYLVLIFFLFLITIIPYYTFLTNIKNPIKNKANANLINLLASFVSLSFGLAIVVYTHPIANTMFNSIIIYLLNFIHSIFISYFGNCSIIVNTYSTTGLDILSMTIHFFSLLQCCLLTIVTAYSLVVIPHELKKDDPIEDILTMMKILKNIK